MGAKQRGVGKRLRRLRDSQPRAIGRRFDIAVRTGNLEVAQRMTAEVIEGALPQFYFHERG